jgi:two-component system sensor histidine kinase QseC
MSTRRWWGPSLARRLLFALVTAFGLVWVVLLAKDYVEAVDAASHQTAIQSATKAIAAALQGRDAASARLIVEVDELQYNALRRHDAETHAVPILGDLLFQLEAPDGQLAYASKALQGVRVDVNPSQARQLTVHGQVYWAASQPTSAGRLTVMEPVLAGPSLLLWIALQELPSLLIAFPLVLIPLWLAVRSGLSPLRHLVSRVSARSPDDFSPIDLQLPYAELQPLEQALDALMAKSRQGIARERAIVQDAAHELRTPLAVVATQAHALANAADADTRQQARQALDAAVQRASHLVHQLLTLAQLDAGDVDRQQTVDLVATTRQILIAANPLADQRHIEVSLESPDRLDATLDLLAYHSVLDNLLRNALNYGQAHGQVRVKLARRSTGQLLLCVADDGPGFAPGLEDKLFDRFHRGQHAGTTGAGLGMAIVKQSVDRLGGSLVLTPGLRGLGVGFEISLPAATTA